MPISASPKRNARPPSPPPPARSPYLWPLLLLVAVAVIVVLVIALPASLLERLLPPTLHAEDFSGSLWHGSAGKLLVNSRDAGAVEWRIHPAALLSLTVSASLHWVKVGFVADGVVDADRRGVVVHDLTGGGPIEDLRDLGVAPGWRGGAAFKFTELKIGLESGRNDADGVTLLAAVGEVRVADLASPQIAAGGDLGGYALHLANGAITPDTDLTAELTDTGGPVQLDATIHYSVKEHTGLLSGTVKQRPEASAALRATLENLAQMHARDAQGRIPVELEFTL